MIHWRTRHGLTLLVGCMAAALPGMVLLAPAVGVAQNKPSGSEASQPAQPDIAHGQAIATGQVQGAGGQQPTYACYTCHGRQGAGAQRANYPRLAGQSFSYLYQALQKFASGERQNQTMQQVAKTLDDKAMRDVAAYYATQGTPQHNQAEAAQASTNPTADALRKGGMLAAYGDMSRGIQGCANCHGPSGGGEPPTYPYLAGQYADYLAGQLKDFASGKRKGSSLGIMHDIAARLTSQQIEDVSQYYASIRPAAPVPQTQGKSALMPPPAEGNGQDAVPSSASAQQPISPAPASGGSQ